MQSETVKSAEWGRNAPHLFVLLDFLKGCVFTASMRKPSAFLPVSPIRLSNAASFFKVLLFAVMRSGLSRLQHRPIRYF